MPVRNAEIIIATKGIPNVISKPPGTNDVPRGKLGNGEASAGMVKSAAAVRRLSFDERPVWAWEVKYSPNTSGPASVRSDQ